VPLHDDQRLFDFLVLEGAQAGLSWETILGRREAYRLAFAGFDPRVAAAFDRRQVQLMLGNADIIRNRLKIESAVRNANAFLEVQGEWGPMPTERLDQRRGRSPAVLAGRDRLPSRVAFP
jgi:DNA-3-methyladenine glycosylase I